MRLSPISLIVLLFVLLAPGDPQSAQREQASTRGDTAADKASSEISELETKAAEADQKGDWQQAAGLYDRLSATARSRGQYQKAISAGKKSLEIANKINAPDLQVQAALQLSRAYTSVRQDATAIDLLE